MTTGREQAVVAPFTDDAVGSTHEASPFVASERTRMLFAQASSGLAINPLIGLALVWLLWDATPHALSMLWLMALLTTTVVRAATLSAYRRNAPRADDLRRWRAYHMLGALGAGAVWGLGPWAFGPHTNFEQHVLLLLTLGGMAVGAIPVLASEFRVYLAFAGTLCALSMPWFLLQGGTTYTGIGVLIAVFLAALLATARNFSASLTRGLVLTEANSRLLSNLTRSKTRETFLRDDRERLRDFAELGADVFWEADRELRYSFLSTRCEEIIGIPSEALIGVELAGPHELFLEGGDEIRSAARDRKTFTTRILSGIRPDGEDVTLLCSGKPLRDHDGEFHGYRGTLHDVTAQQLLSSRLAYQATHDALTDTLNRREFEARLVQALQNARQKDGRHALLYMDLDQFKVINDTCGHPAGDALLQQITALIRAKLRTRDSFARIGGDEFGVLMEQCTVASAVSIAEELCRAIADFRFDWSGTTFSLGVSIGIVELSADSDDPAQCLSAADSACYVAKDAGRNRVQVFDSSDSRINRRRQETQWVNRINDALRENTLRLFAQPITPIWELPTTTTARRFRNCELLLRFPDGSGGMELPKAVLPISERFNLAPELDIWVIRRALCWLSDPKIAAEVESCSINLSGKSLDDPTFSKLLFDELQRAQVPPSVLCFEITETAAVNNIAAAAHFMDNMRKHGCRFALDDFGTGYSSFAYLKDLPADYLKIDGLFVSNLLTDPTDRELVASMHSLGRIFGMKTVAEFVDKPDLFRPLQDIGVDYAQGFAVGMPVPIDHPGVEDEI